MIQIPRLKPFRTFALVTLNSSTYVCPGFHLVPNGTTRDDIQLIEVDEPKVKKVETKEVTTSTEILKVKVPSSNGKSSYTVSRDRTWSCTCPAFMYRRGDCKHITSVKKKELKLS